MIAIASDHAGFALKEHLKHVLDQLELSFRDFGAYGEESVDYPEFASAAAQAVSTGVCDRGIFICGTGIGMSIVANKYKGVRAAECLTVEAAMLARSHNDANVLTMGQRLIDFQTAEAVVRAFLATPFEGGRHQRRVEKIHTITGL